MVPGNRLKQCLYNCPVAFADHWSTDNGTNSTTWPLVSTLRPSLIKPQLTHSIPII
jgi:hypothetical protein